MSFQPQEWFSSKRDAIWFDQKFKGPRMNLFVWTEMLATGNKFMDEDHHELVRRVNTVLETIALQQGEQGLSAAMDELAAYSREHFAREEVEMKRIDFKNMHAHMTEHATLLKQLQAMRDQLDAGKKFDQMDLYHFLAWWVKDHIRDFDVELAEALASRS